MNGLSQGSELPLFCRRRQVVDAARHVAVLGIVLGVAPLPAMLCTSCNYTWSLLIFILPIAVILSWFLLSPEEELRPVRKAFWLTLGLLIPMGVVLNLLFADEFFQYPDRQAVIGLSVPSLDFFAIDWEHPIPLEEFVFYVTGFLAILLVYIWGSETFFSRYLKRLGPGAGASPEAIVRLAAAPLLVTVLLILAAVGLKQLHGGGFPGYLVYLLALPFLVTTALYKVAAPYVNWRAFSFLLLFILADSLMWEVTLALPGGWWGYRKEQMVGLFIEPWHDLPVEAVLVWVMSALTTVITFEAARVFFHHPVPGIRRRLFARNDRTPGDPARCARGGR